MDFKDKLKMLRNENGLSQEALAEAVHISRSAIAKYENGNGIEKNMDVAVSYYKMAAEKITAIVEELKTLWQPLDGFLEQAGLAKEMIPGGRARQLLTAMCGAG